MSKIIAGRFDTTVDADAAVEALRREGFTREEIDSFYGALIGALGGGLIGMLIGFLVAHDYGAVVILFGAGVGAYVGSFLGAMRKVHHPRPEDARPDRPLEVGRGGRMIAVNVDRPAMDARAIEVLREFGAHDVGRAEGDWRNGWKDFDPRAPLMTP
jgi:hypothetical protein